jgi:hypothetical protein
MKNIFKLKTLEFNSLNTLSSNPFINNITIILFIFIFSKPVFPLLIPNDTIQGYSYFGEKKYPSQLPIINNSSIDSITIDSGKVILPFQCEEVISVRTTFDLDSTKEYLQQKINNLIKGKKLPPLDTFSLSNVQITVWLQNQCFPLPFQCSPSGAIIRDTNFVVSMILYSKNSTDTVYYFGRIYFMGFDGVLNSPKRNFNSPGNIRKIEADLSGRKLPKGAKGLIISNNKKKVILKSR